MNWREFNAVSEIQKIVDSVKTSNLFVFLQPINNDEGNVDKIYVSVEYTDGVSNVITGRIFDFELFISNKDYIICFEASLKNLIARCMKY